MTTRLDVPASLSNFPFLKSRRTVISGAALALSACSLLGQGITTGSLSGTVADATGGVLPGATVTVTRPSTNEKFTTQTHGDGSFSLKNLPVGTYTVVITSPGFANLSLERVLIDANKEEALGVEKLSTGAATETVEVSAASTLLETTQAQVTATFDSLAVTQLPTGGGFDELTLLIPGVVNVHSDNFSNSNGVGFSSNGTRGRSNNFEIDGQSNNDNSVAGPQFFFGADEAISEVQVITNNFSAQYGRDSGAVVNYITKQGTNSYHGSATYRYAGDFTSSHAQGISKGPQFGFCVPGENTADGCLPAVVPRFVSNNYGGTFGGRILKDKLFGFGSAWFQRFFEHGGLTSSGTGLFPTTAGLAQLATAYPNNPAIKVLQQLNPLSIAAGNPRYLGTAVNRTVSDGTTTTTVPFQQYGRQLPVSATDKELLGRLDYQATGKDRFFLRYLYQLAPTSPDGPVANGSYINVTSTTHAIGADWTRTFSPRWVNQLRYSFQQSKLAFDGGGFPQCTISAYATCPSSIALGAGVTGLGLASNLPQGRIVKVGQVQDNASVSIGRHTLTFGGEFDYQNSPNTFLPNQNGAFTFTSFNNFLKGAGTLSLTSGNPTIPFREKDVAVYFQDDWKVSPSFTANIGLRWEFFQQALNLLHAESVAQQTGPNPFWNTALPLSKTTFPSIPQSYRNFEPRIGFAFNPRSMPKLVLRGGYAINVDPGFYNINLNSATAAPLVNAGTITCDGVTVKCLPSNGTANYTSVRAQFLPLIPTGGDPGARNETNVSPNFRQPMTQSYTLAIEQQLGTAAVFSARYAGNHVAGQFQSLDANPYLAPVAAAFPNVVNPASLCTTATSTLAAKGDVGREYCGYTNVRTRANTAFSNYNSLQLNLTTRAYHGFTGTAAYTHSKVIDNGSEIFSTFGGGNTVAFAQNPLDPNYAERAVSGIDFPNVGSIGLVYKLPTVHIGNAFVSKVANGWSANTVWLYNSGQPYTPYDLYVNQSPQTNSSDSRTYMDYSDYKAAAAFASGATFARPIVSNKNAPLNSVGIYTTTTNAAGQTSAPQLVDYATGAPVSANAVHFISNNRLAAQIYNNPFPGASRNLQRGNTYNNVDFSVFKDTKLTERVNFRLEAIAYNVLNRSYYGTPDNFLGDYGTSFSTNLYSTASGSNIGFGTGVRNLQFGGKVLF